MPPSGPSALWSSNNSIQNTTTAVPAQDHHNGIMMNNNRGGGGGHHDVIGSLGKVLSNVNLAGGGGGEYSDNSGHGSVGGGGGGGQPSSQQGGGYGAPGTAVGSHPGSWSGLSASAAPAPAPAGLSYNFYNNNNNGSSNQPTNNVPIKNSSSTTTNNNEPHDSLQNILYDSGIYEKEEVAVHRRASATGGSSPLSTSDHNNHRRPSERKPSIDIFLSQSPSKALGEDAFRVMNRTASNPSLVGLNYPNQHGDNNGMASNNGNNNNVGLGGKPLASTAPSSRSESPQNLVRAGSSNGSSPYGGGSGTTNANNARQMYPSQFTATAQTFSPSGVGNTATQQHHQQHGGGSQLHAQLQQQPSLSSQYSSSSNNIPGLINGQQQQQQQPQHHQPQQQQQQQQPVQQQQYMPMPVSQQQQQQQQPQVFYMAVAGPDGKQVLQPVQMVQMPGQAGTLMMPVAAASAAPPTGNTQGQDGQMMLMQPAAAGQAQQQGSSNGMNTMYGGGQQDNQGVGGGGGIVGSSNNQYSQYGQQQQSGVGGYDTMNGNHHHHHRGGYQSKNAVDNANNIIGGNNHYQPNNNDQGGNNNNNILVGGAGGVIVDPSQVPAGSLSMLYSSPQRPPLRALLGNVRRLSRDQVGCRLLQQALDEDGPSAATAILNEGLTFWAEAMVDPFGNYLFQKILERITPEERVTLVSSVSTRLVNASLNLHGTRSVQKIVEVCAVDEEENEENEEFAQQDGGGINKEVEENKKLEEEEESKASKSNKKGKKKKETAAKILTDALKPSAARLCIDSHGNHAIQRILLKLPYQYTQFIFDAVAASVEDVARHRHGCCVIQRCLDSRHSAARTHLVSRIVEKSLELMQDAYGNYVVQYVLDVCGDDEVHAICESVIGKVCLLAIQKFSSNVMEKCLERCTDRVREEYLNELNDSDRIRELMMDPFGNYVVQRALSVSTHAQAIRLVETMKPHLSSQNGGGIRNTAGGRRILGKICRRFPNFVLEGETFEDYDLNQVLARGSPHHHHNNPPGVGGGGGRRQNQFGMNPHNPGPSPNHRRNNRGRGNQHHHQHQQHTIPQYQQPQVGHHVNVQQPDMSVMQPAYHHQATGAHPYLFPHSM